MIKKRLDKILDNRNKRSSKPLVLLLILSIIGSSFLIGCETKENLTDKLYKNKTEFIGERSDIEDIISNLEFPKGYKYKSVVVSEDENSYSIALSFNPEKGIRYDSDIFNVHSAILFSLIDNLDEIIYLRQPEGVEGIDPFDRAYIDNITNSVLGNTTQELGSSKEKFKELMKFYVSYMKEGKTNQLTDHSDKLEVQEPPESEIQEAITKVDLEPTKHETVNNLEGVAMFTREETSSKGVTLFFGNKTQTQVIYSDDFLLEKKMDGKWYELPVTIDGEYAFKDISYRLPFDGGPDQKVEWEWLYGELDPGEYRIIKEILDFRSTGDFDSYFFAAEFEID